MALQELVNQVVKRIGPLLALSLARSIGGNASRSELDKLSEPLKKLIARQPMSRVWLEAAMADESFPSPNVSAADKALFLKKIIS
jgi:hypothetical protein